MNTKYFRHGLAAALAGLLAAGMASSCSESTDSPVLPEATASIPMSWDGAMADFAPAAGSDNESRSINQDGSWTWETGNKVLIYDNDQSATPLGIATYSGSNKWTFTPQGTMPAEGNCVAYFTLDAQTFNEYHGRISVSSSNPLYRGEGVFKMIDGELRLSCMLSPACARLCFIGNGSSTSAFATDYASGNYRLATHDFFTEPASVHEFSALDWISNGRSHYIYIIDDLIPRVKVGNTVYRYRADARTPEAGQTILLSFPGTPGSENTWMSAPYVKKTASLSRTNIYGSVTRNLINEMLESEIGFLFYVDFEWTPYSGSLTQTTSNMYPFFVNMTIGDETEDYYLCEIDGTSGVRMQVQGLYNDTRFGNIIVKPANSNDVYVTIHSLSLSNF